MGTTVSSVPVYPYPEQYATLMGQVVCFAEDNPKKWDIFLLEKNGKKVNYVRSYTRKSSVQRRIAELAGLPQARR